MRLVPRNVGHLSLPSLLAFYLQLTVSVPSTYYQRSGNQPNWGSCSCYSSSLGVWVSIHYSVSHTFIHWRYFCFLSNRTPKANHEIKKSSKNHPEIQEKSIKKSRNPGLWKLTAERDKIKNSINQEIDHETRNKNQENVMTFCAYFSVQYNGKLVSVTRKHFGICIITILTTITKIRSLRGVESVHPR